MSTCPEKELLSTYVDKEISSPWLERIREHLETCDSCASYVRRLEKIRFNLKSHADQFDTDTTQLDESFKRLQTRLRYTEVVSPQQSLSSLFFRRVVPAMAAAAVFALILPIQVARNQTPAGTLTAIKRIQRQLPKNTGVVSDGTMTNAELASMIGRPSARTINLTLQNSPLFSLEIKTETIPENHQFLYLDMNGFQANTIGPVFEQVRTTTYKTELQY